MARSYFFHFVLSTLTILLGAALINFMADPYSIWGAPSIKGLNSAKYSVFHERIQYYSIWSHWSRPPQTILLGTSKAGGGLRANHPAFGDDATYNMALGGQPIRETLLLFKHALKAGALKKVVIGLDFFAFNSYWASDFASQERRLMPGHNFDLLFNASTLSDSFSTLKQSWPEMELVSSAHAAETTCSVCPNIPMRTLFLGVEKIFISYHRPYPYHIFSYKNIRTGDDTLQDFREILKIAHENNIDLYLFISPSHAWHWEGLANIDLWTEWEGWKRELVRINEEESRRAGKQLYPLWDFSGYNSITTEALPAPGAPNTMKCYADSAHYIAACGDLVLDRVLGYSAPAANIPDDFGEMINGQNIEQHLQEIRSARKQYELAHPADIREMVTMAQHEWRH